MYNSQSHYDNATDDHLFVDQDFIDNRITDLTSCHNDELAAHLNNEEMNAPDFCDEVTEIIKAVCKHYDAMPSEIKEILNGAAKKVAEHEEAKR